MKHTFGNRRDIDGLRALAVIPVVLFHYGFGAFSGGFVGVDVFFVISGFLITSIIYRDIQANRFSFYEFWSRRARRIIPALSVMMAVVLLAGWLLLPPPDYSQLGRAVRYQAMFVSNLLYRHQDGYFDSASTLKPLLHTWSLSVEEQYYIFFPLIMVLIIRYTRLWRFGLFGLLILSFFLNIWSVTRQPDAAFFLLPTRAWELLCGAALAVLPTHERRLRPVVYQVVSLAGLAAVVAAVCWLDKNTLFPSWAALLPVLGATAMIWANGHSPTWVAKLLSSRVMVGIGLISYSLYLWHWPIFVFANAVSVDGLQLSEACGWVVLSLLLGYLSWRFIELPFRQKNLLVGRRNVVVAGALSMLVLAIMGQTVRWADGVPGRLSDQAMRYALARSWHQGQMECLMHTQNSDLNTVCHFGASAGTPSLLVWGDSHAAALMPAFKAGAEQFNTPVWLTSLAGCPPVIDANVRKQCADFNQKTLDIVRREKVRDVVLVGRWSLYLYGEEDGATDRVIFTSDLGGSAEQHMAQDLRSLVARVRDSGARVWLFKEVPMQRQGNIRRLSSLAMVGRSTSLVSRPIEEYRARQRFIDQLFAQLSAADPQVRVIDPADLLCAGGVCHAEIGGVLLYMDENHLSDQGGERMKPLFDPIFLSGNAR